MKVNGHEASPGCYIAGHHGQYGVDGTADVCAQFGIEVDEKNHPTYWRERAEAAEEADEDHSYWEHWADAGTCCEAFLNDVTEGGYWSWEDGEFFLIQTEVESVLFIVAWNEEDAWLHLIEGNTDHVYLREEEAIEQSQELDREGQKVYQFPITIKAEDIFA